MSPAPLPECFAGKFVEIESGCWLWTAAKDPTGYGRIRIQGKLELAHRVSYATVFGAIPEGLQLDHLCRVRNCIRPDHLEAVTQRENILRGEGITAKNARKTHCLRGHPLSGDNLLLSPRPQTTLEDRRRDVSRT